MKWSLLAVCIGYCIDLIVGDPHSLPHPVIAIGKLISFLEKHLRRIVPKTSRGENIAGGFLWLTVILLSGGIPAFLLLFCHRISPFLRLFLESIMCWQILATKSLKDETMKVYQALKTGTLADARYAVSMIVGRDTARLDADGITRAAVETVAENTSDGIIAPLFFLVLGGAPLGMLYKGVNTMDSMLGYVEMPYKNIGLVPAKMDDLFNFIPARLSALLMLLAGAILKLDVKNGWKIFKRDRFNHASPNSAQTESVCAGLLRVRLAGDAWYHGVLHTKKYIGDDLRPIHMEDIPAVCRLLYVSSFLTLILFTGLRVLTLFL